MNVASKDLCAELYELSGWENLDYVWVDNYRWQKSVKTPKFIVARATEKNEGVSLPAYNLGYLLRKLPDGTQLNKTTVQYSVSGIYTIDGHNKSFHCNADTPEDAACKLSIELFKQGVLTA